MLRLDKANLFVLERHMGVRRKKHWFSHVLMLLWLAVLAVQVIMEQEDIHASVFSSFI